MINQGRCAWFEAADLPAARAASVVGSHTSVPQLRAAIQEYVKVHNEEPAPFVWTKTAD
jgi:hypothetical protein